MVKREYIGKAKKELSFGYDGPLTFILFICQTIKANSAVSHK